MAAAEEAGVAGSHKAVGISIWPRKTVAERLSGCVPFTAAVKDLEEEAPKE